MSATSNRATTFILESPTRGKSAAERAATDLARQPGVRYLQSILVPLEGRCLHLIEGPSAEAITKAALAAAVVFEQVVKAFDVSPEQAQPSVQVLRAA